MIIIIIVIIVVIIIIAQDAGASARQGIHSCHILPFQPILWNRYFPPEPATTAKHSPKSIPNLYSQDAVASARRGVV